MTTDSDLLAAWAVVEIGAVRTPEGWCAICGDVQHNGWRPHEELHPYAARPQPPALLTADALGAAMRVLGVATLPPQDWPALTAAAIHHVGESLQALAQLAERDS